jgi:hypothetical protein
VHIDGDADFLIAPLHNILINPNRMQRPAEITPDVVLHGAQEGPVQILVAHSGLVVSMNQPLRLHAHRQKADLVAFAFDVHGLLEAAGRVEALVSGRTASLTGPE